MELGQGVAAGDEPFGYPGGYCLDRIRLDGDSSGSKMVESGKDRCLCRIYHFVSRKENREGPNRRDFAFLTKLTRCRWSNY